MENLKEVSKNLRKEAEKATGELLQIATKHFSFTALDDESKELMTAIVNCNNVMARGFEYIDALSEKIDAIYESVIKEDEKSKKLK